MCAPIFYAPHSEVLGPLDFKTLQTMQAKGELASSTLFWYDDGRVPQWLDWQNFIRRYPPDKSQLRVEMEKLWTEVDPDWRMKAMGLWLQKIRRRQGYYVYPLHPKLRNPLLVGNPIMCTLR